MNFISNFNKDSDKDGLSDADEKKLGTNPLNSDTDGDGVSDDEELRQGTNPLGVGSLKDLFIPHAGNDYSPRALHPKRLFFYGLTALLMKVVVMATIVIFPLGAWLTPDLLLEQSRKIIELTNKIRQENGIALLKENSRLTQAAFKKAEDMLLNQYFAHAGLDGKTVGNWLSLSGYRYALAGENLAMGFSGAEEVVNGWIRSKTHWANLIDQDFSEIGVGLASGLYNDHDTTFVAQFFGAPAQPVANFLISKQNNLPASASLENSGEAVKGEKESGPPLVAPIFISPAKGLVDGNLVKIKVFAPEAEKVLIYEGSVKVASAEVDDSYASLTVNLPEGRHSLKAVSTRGEERKESEVYNLMIDTTPPAVDQARTELILAEPAGQRERVVRAIAYLSPDTVLAEVVFNNYHIALTKDASDSNKWIGQTIIFDQGEEQIFNPVVLPVLSATDWAGNKTVADIGWDKIIPAKTSLLDQYFFLKTYPTDNLKSLFDISSIYYKILLAILVLALILNVFIKIKKQKPHLIASALGLIFLLAILIVY